ncbi:TRIC cation channel family protein, partial [Photobacterium sanctipauli]|uniref:TRIC cation channel family protein n=1 Tax=Photobacterium sanctipauli TaxID=1342794 RepID=UPI0005605D08
GGMTGCGGGVIRDVLAREIPMVLRTEVYATACILGGIVHTTALMANVDATVATVAGIVTTLTIRLAAIRWHLSLPTFALRS